MRRTRWSAILMAATLGTLWAQGPANPPEAPGPDDAADAQDAGAQDHGVGRISVVQGEASVRRGDSGESVAAVVNSPVLAGDHLLTAAGGRSEVQFDAANLVRLGANADLQFGNLDGRRYQLQLGAGTIIFRVLRPSDAHAEIDTPSVSVRPAQPGVYRITVRDDGTSEITVRAGDADVFSPKGSEELAAGRTMQARGPASDPEFQVGGAVPVDEFEQWSASRDQSMLRSPAYQHVSPDMPGADDMDGRGTWVQDPTYGSVWQPSADPGWAPYQNGRWVWEDYYGWTWVSYDPWGWAPYHYGRWFRGSLGWCWWPGPFYRHYYWSPALVGFFGFGGGFGFGFGFGNVGWVPLAPFEPFHRWWGPGFYGRGFGHTSIINNYNVVNTFRNARYAGGVTAMNSSQFGRAAVNGRTMVRPASNDLAHAGGVRGMLPLTPGRESLSATSRSVNPGAFRSPASNFSGRGAQTFQGSRSFEQQRQSMDQLAHNTFGGTSRTGANTMNSAAPRVATGGAASGGVAGNGWQRFNGMANGGSANRSTVNGGGTPANRTYGGSYNRGGYTSGGNSGSYNRGYSAPGGYSSPSRNYSAPVRISPPMVSQRPSGGYSSGASNNSNSHPGFGRPESRGSYGGGGGGGGGSRGGGAVGGGGGHSGGGGRGGGHR